VPHAQSNGSDNEELPLAPNGRGEAFALRAVMLMATLALIGCVGIRTPGEKAARSDLQRIETQFRPDGFKPALPNLSTNSPLQDYLQFAALNQPQVEAAYFDWAAFVQRITVERSLPDPRLTFEADIADVVMTLMPGFMFDLPGPGKLRAAADVATAESQAAYFKFAQAVLQSAYNLKRAYYQLHFLQQRIAVNRQTLDLLGFLEKLARTQNEVGKATLQDVLRSQIEQERLRTEIANLEDSRNPLLAQFKGALGLDPAAPDPPLPAVFASTAIDLSAPDLFERVLARNPRLRAMEAEIRMADASIRVAQRGRIPYFSLGIEADIKPSPWMWRPQVGVTLPIWRDKIAAQIAGAQASRRAAQARLSAEQIMLAVDFAERAFMVRESERNLSLLRERLLPRAEESLQVARAGYAANRVDFINLIDAERTLLEFQLAEVEAQTQRELALAELSLLIFAEPPPGAPWLKTQTQSASP
jgi:outer membrane protein, heavy metal efflux system